MLKTINKQKTDKMIGVIPRKNILMETFLNKIMLDQNLNLAP